MQAANQFQPVDEENTPATEPERICEGCSVTIHGDLKDYPAVIIKLYCATQRASVQWWCDVRQTWFIGAVDMARIQLYEHPIACCRNCGAYDWSAQLDAAGLCPYCQPTSSSPHQYRPACQAHIVRNTFVSAVRRFKHLFSPGSEA